MMIVWRDTPLCPAGHLPLKGGERLDAGSSLFPSGRARPSAPPIAALAADLISPLEGEMAGRPEGGKPPFVVLSSSDVTSQEAHHAPRS